MALTWSAAISYSAAAEVAVLGVIVCMIILIIVEVEARRTEFHSRQVTGHLGWADFPGWLTDLWRYSNGLGLQSSWEMRAMLFTMYNVHRPRAHTLYHTLMPCVICCSSWWCKLATTYTSSLVLTDLIFWPSYHWFSLSKYTHNIISHFRVNVL